ncbi:MAG: hypothetical protein SGPRY_003509, partial [Prymnesium sp.]
ASRSEKNGLCTEITKRRTRPEKAESDLFEVENKLEELARKRASIVGKASMAASAKQTAMEKINLKQKQLEDLCEAARAAVEAARKSAELAGAAAASRAAKAKEKEQGNRPIDTSDSIWAHIHFDLSKEVESEHLPKSDLCSAVALQERFSTELGEFRLRCATANTVQCSC